LANGTIHRLSHGRFMMKPASEGADMFAELWLAIWSGEYVDIMSGSVNGSFDRRDTCPVILGIF